MVTHSSILAWKIPWTEEPSGLQSMGSQESDTTERLNHHQQQKEAVDEIRWGWEDVGRHSKYIIEFYLLLNVRDFLFLKRRGMKS